MISKTKITGAVLFLFMAFMINACSKKESGSTGGGNNSTPQGDYLKIGDLTFTGAANMKVTAGFKGITRKTELKIYTGNPQDTFFGVEHDTVLINHPCKSGLGETFKDSTVYFYCRLGFVLGYPILMTVQDGKKYGSYVVKTENGKRVSIFSGIILEDMNTKKRYTCEGRITWP
jgi:hypothetical protein